jgi:hypothetical protein
MKRIAFALIFTLLLIVSAAANTNRQGSSKQGGSSNCQDIAASMQRQGQNRGSVEPNQDQSLNTVQDQRGYEDDSNGMREAQGSSGSGGDYQHGEPQFRADSQQRQPEQEQYGNNDPHENNC